jgi:hypothetical protein
LRGLLQNDERGLARDCRRVDGDRTRLQTPRGSEPVYGVAPRFGRIDTLKCGETPIRSVFGHGGSRWSKHMRGGLRPND